MGERGEGLTGTTIKDIWTITRGGWEQEGGGEGWGVGRGRGERQKTILEQQ